jgi:glycosyltransferase involved in cell wall biosynthesis
MNPKISIIIPVYNRESLITETINSIKNQTYQDFECIIIDDGSTDNTRNIIDKNIYDDFRFKVFLRDTNYIKGPSGCRNMGLDMARGQYIQFFDSDDLMHEDHLQCKIDAYTEDTDLVVCQLAEFKGTNYEDLFNINNIDDKGNLLNHINGDTNYYLPGPMWRKQIVRSCRFDNSIKIYEDLLFNLINRKKCSNIILINSPLIYYRRHDNSTTGISTQDIQILEQKRLAWKYIYEVLIEGEQSNMKYKKQIRSIFFQKSCLNFYYLLCQKSFLGSLKQSLDMVKYSTTIKERIIFLKLFFLSIIPFVSKKGYKIYKINNNLLGN